MIAVIDLGILLALVVAPVAWFMDPLHLAPGPLRITVGWSWKTVVVPLLLLGARVLLRWVGVQGTTSRGPLDLRVLQGVALAVAVTFLSLLGVEQVLVLATFESRAVPIVIRGATDDPGASTEGLVPDPELRWRLNPGVEFMGRRVNSLGFMDREADPVKAPGTIRVLALGDSCTAIGPPTYSEILHGLLAVDPPTPQRWQAMNMGVHGYSVAQGLRLFRLRGRALAPDVVTIYFGWNDHWLEGPLTDSQQMAVQVGPRAAAFRETLGSRRVGQLFLRALGASRGVSTSEEKIYRVPPEEYRRTLRQLVEEVRSAGAIPVLITAPRSQWVTRLVVTRGHARSVPEVGEDHDRYAAITREVADEQEAFLLDLAREFDAAPQSKSLLLPDGIHPTGAGRELIAGLLHDALRRIAVSGRWRDRAAGQ